MSKFLVWERSSAWESTPLKPVESPVQIRPFPLRLKRQEMGKMVNKKRKSREDYFVFVRRTEEAWKRYEKGEFKSMDYKKFLEEIKKW